MIAELDVERIAVFEAEANAPLIVDRDGVLARTIALQRVQSVTGRDTQVGESDGHVHGLQLPQGASRHVCGDPLRLPGPEQLFGLPISEGSDHTAMERVT